MYRAIIEDMLRWKESQSRKPLIIKGARQIGKTWVMQEFGRQHFKNTVYINFDNNEIVKGIFENDYDTERIIRNLSAYSGKPIIPEDTLIIFDEIQEIPKGISALKYFCENASEYAIVAAGSLLGTAIHAGVSFPVGKVDILHMYPMSFYEFLRAVGEEPLADIVYNRDFDAGNINGSRFADWLKNYYYIGGMPEAVLSFSQRRDYTAVRNIQNNIIELYESDFSKHTPTAQLPRIRMVWNSIPVQLAKENKKFFFGAIKKGARSKDYEIAIEWLYDCGLVHKVYRVVKPHIPLKAYVELSAFKLFLSDIGLLAAMTGLDSATIVNGNTIFTEFKGALTEQYVLQELMCNRRESPFYYSETSSEGEIDFIIQDEGKAIPIEVKASENLRAKSFKNFCKKFAPDNAVRTSMSHYREEDWFTNIPLWMIGGDITPIMKPDQRKEREYDIQRF